MLVGVSLIAQRTFIGLGHHRLPDIFATLPYCPPTLAELVGRICSRHPANKVSASREAVQCSWVWVSDMTRRGLEPRPG